MSKKKITLKTAVKSFIDIIGYKPHGNNKQFKELMKKYNVKSFQSPKERREFLIKVVDDKKFGEPARKIQTAFKKFTQQKKAYINDFKNKLRTENKINLKSKDIKKNIGIKRFLETIKNEIDMKNKNIGISFNQKINYTLSPENINYILNMIKNDGDLEEIDNIYDDSKTEIAYELLTAENIYITTFNKRNTNKLEEGAFFPYYLKDDINIDLSDLQIFKQNQFLKDRNLDNCLLYSLKLCGYDDAYLKIIKDMIKLKHIPIKDLKIVCDRLKINIILWKFDNKTRKIEHGKKYNKKVNIGIIENHYFLVKETFYTSYSIKNYDKIKHLKDFNMIYNDIGYKSTKRFINSFDLLNIMMKNKEYFFTKIDAGNIHKYDEIYLNKLIDNSFNCLDYDESNYRLIEFDKTKIEPDLNIDDDKTKIIYFDFETGIFLKNDLIYVEPFLCCTIDNEGNKKSFIGENCAYEMLSSLKTDTILVAHNAKFDYTFITKYLWKCKEITNGSAFITYKGYFNNLKIQIKDSVKLIPMPLCEFPKSFKLDFVKEFMPYKLYTEENINLRYIDYDKVLTYIDNDKDKEIFDENITKWNLMKNDKVDMIEYARLYCEIDVKLLRDGYNIFRDNCITHFNIDINKVLTIPSLADKYFIMQGCYDDIYEISGTPQQFIQKCVVGGRTMCCNNEKIIKENVIINDFDAVSLYPSAMYRMKGFLKGLPKILKETDYNVIKNYDGYFIQIKIKKIGIKRNFGLCSYIDENKGVRNFTNDLIDKIIYIDKTGLEDLIEFQDVEFEIIKGYYFDEGFNNKINEVIKYVFDKRLELKKQKNVGQLIYKLIMNSTYGKTIQKSPDTELKLFDNKERFEVYLSRNYNKVKNWLSYDDDKKFKVEIGCNMTQHFNRCHIGVEILSMSKRIMNEVICLAEDNKLNIYYQDTDSIHIENKDIEILSNLYKNKYNKDLIGEDMGQFHSDFELDGATKNIVATDSIFLGKKSYIDKLIGYDDKGNKVEGFHFRMKGIPSKVVKHYCEQNDIDLFNLYKKLYNGEKIKFDLTRGGEAFNIKHQKDYTINIMSEFNRVVCF